MELSDKAEEILESLFVATRENPGAAAPLSRLAAQESPDTPEEHAAGGYQCQVGGGAHEAPEAVEELVAAGFASRQGEALALTDAGRVEGEGILRRHCLAERLLIDVLDVGEELVHQAACRFEHIIRRGIDDRICTLLGHPRFCPHGTPIPPGPCCQENRDAARQVVAPLAALPPGSRGRIAYIHTQERSNLEKLIAMGALPGTDVLVIQTFPSYVFQVGQTQVAADRQIADSIYVRLEHALRGAPDRRRGRRRLGRRQ